MALQTVHLRESIRFEDLHTCAWMFDGKIEDLHGCEQIATGLLGQPSFHLSQRVLNERSSLVVGILITYRFRSSDSS